MNLLCGTSGFSYKEWKGSFYPKNLADKEMLSFYADWLSAVEINISFYKMPSEDVFQAWAKRVSGKFRFAVKASRSITHFRRLKEVSEECNILFETVRSLGRKVGCVFFQLPPNFKKDIHRLESFLKIIPKDINAAFEFRNNSWFDDETYQILRNKNCALVITETDETREVQYTKTADWTYLRLRCNHYSNNELMERMDKIQGGGWGNVFVFFKHEDEGTGPRLAKQFINLI